jgi:hypothetical protein
MLPAPAVVVPTAELAVLEGGAAGRPGVDVVALAAFGGLVAVVVGALLVADLEGVVDGAGEAASAAGR